MTLLHKLSLWWKKDPIRGKICLILTATHLLALGFITHTPTPIKKNHKIVVRTLQASAPSIVTSASTQKKQVSAPQKKPTTPAPVKKKEVTPPKPATPKAPIKEPPKKVEKKPSPTKKAPPTPKKTKVSPPPPPSPSHDLQKSLKEIEETIAKIATNNDKMSSRVRKEPLPKLDNLPESLSLPLELEEDYASSLVEYLEEHLRLPDSGEVKIELTLRKDGSIEAVKVLSAKSEQNKKRLEEHLPRLHFPPFPKEEKEKKSKVFILTFCNDF